MRGVEHGVPVAIAESQARTRRKYRIGTATKISLCYKTELHWSEESGKHLELRRPIETGTILFLRLLDPKNVDRVQPLPSVADRVRARGE